jgi:hypothetical protein
MNFDWKRRTIMTDNDFDRLVTAVAQRLAALGAAGLGIPSGLEACEQMINSTAARATTPTVNRVVHREANTSLDASGDDKVAAITLHSTSPSVSIQRDDLPIEKIEIWTAD